LARCSGIEGAVRFISPPRRARARGFGVRGAVERRWEEGGRFGFASSESESSLRRSQIVEGWYGEPWRRPYHRIKDYVTIVKKAGLARE
jgi:hypothetical protein